MTRRAATVLALALVMAACSGGPGMSTGRPTPSQPPPTAAGQPTPTDQSTPSGGPSLGSQPAPTVRPTAGTQPPDVTLEPFVGGLGALTFVAHAPDASGDMCAVEQRGVVDRLAPDGSVSGPFLDISDRVSSGGERGLLGLAFHPDFRTNGRLFVDYTDVSGNTVVAQFSRAADAALADPGSERVLLTIQQPFANHNGGMLAFGPDGHLYVGTGDGGSGGDPMGNGQNTSRLLGKILRIDVDGGDPYAIPAGNPFAGGPGAPEIWDWGLRNPWRFSFDRSTGALFIGDVGQGTREEIDAEPPAAGGRNYGWNITEGDICYGADTCDATGLTAPVFAYGHDAGNCAITGGYVYRGARFPQLDGWYLFSDYCSGTLWALNADAALASGTAQAHVVGHTGLTPSAFGEDESGELYLVDLSGAIYRLAAVSI